MLSRVLTSYDLQTGLVLWLTAGGDWSPLISEARIALTEDNIKEMDFQAETAHAEHKIFEIYWVDVAEKPDGPEPVKYRELLRSRGPTIHPHFGPQSLEGIS